MRAVYERYGRAVHTVAVLDRPRPADGGRRRAVDVPQRLAVVRPASIPTASSARGCTRSPAARRSTPTARPGGSRPSDPRRSTSSSCRRRSSARGRRGRSAVALDKLPPDEREVVRLSLPRRPDPSRDRRTPRRARSGRSSRGRTGPIAAWRRSSPTSAAANRSDRAGVGKDDGPTGAGDPSTMSDDEPTDGAGELADDAGHGRAHGRLRPGPGRRCGVGRATAGLGGLHRRGHRRRRAAGPPSPPPAPAGAGRQRRPRTTWWLAAAAAVIAIVAVGVVATRGR